MLGIDLESFACKQVTPYCLWPIPSFLKAARETASFLVCLVTDFSLKSLLKIAPEQLFSLANLSLLNALLLFCFGPHPVVLKSYLLVLSPGITLAGLRGS